MKKYDYYEEMKNDILEYINDYDISLSNYDSIDEMFESLHDDMWDDDAITGNVMGYDTAEKCEEYLLHNWDLIFTALDDFGVGYKELEKINRKDLPIYLDSTIRCSLLGQVLGDVIEQLENE